MSLGLMEFAAGVSPIQTALPVLGYSRRHNMKVYFAQVKVSNSIDSLGQQVRNLELDSVYSGSQMYVS